MLNAQPVTGSRSRRLEAARVHQRWVSTAGVVNQQILAIHKLSLTVRDTESRAFLSECVASLEDVNDAIHELHVAVIDPKLRPWLTPDSTLSAYISACYAWCANVLSSLTEIVALGEGTLFELGEHALAHRSSAYVRTMLEPLFQRVGELCEPVLASDHPLSWIYDRAQHVESEIACLDWELHAEDEAAEQAEGVAELDD